MEKTTIPFSQTNNFSKLISDYFSGAIALKEFYNYKPSVDSFQQILENRKKFPVNRKVLVNELMSQHATVFADKNLGSEATIKNIQLLADENTFTVTTGHQLNIFTGPLYFIYKILTAINLSEKLSKKFPHYNFVPVYWMATEDHDYDEIKSVMVYGKKITWQTNQTGAVGRFNIQGFEDIINQLENILDKNENTNELIELLKQAYCSGATLSEATRQFVHSLFCRYGLVIIDADSKELKKAMISFFEKEITESTSFNNVSHANKQMQMLYGVQVQPRELNLFYLSDNSRNRITYQNGKFNVVGTEIFFTKEEMLAEIKNHPERISPNVILRPVYQEVILPNLAYIGGPAELHYWLQFKSMFEGFNVF